MCRDFIQDGLVEFARKNPQLQIRTAVVPQKAPVVIGEYGESVAAATACAHDGSLTGLFVIESVFFRLQLMAHTEKSTSKTGMHCL
jgi:hypothetical protein